MLIKYAVFSFLILGISCSSSSRQLDNPKFDAPLLKKIEEVDRSGSQEEIKVFGKCAEQINDQMRKSIEETGTRVESVMGNLFTAAGSPVALKQLVRLDFVSQLQLSTASKPL